MLDIRFVRENPDIVKENIKKKFQDAKLPLVDEVIDLDTGQRLGYVRDALVDSETGRVRALIIPGRLRCLGLLGRGPELTPGAYTHLKLPTQRIV